MSTRQIANNFSVSSSAEMQSEENRYWLGARVLCAEDSESTRCILRLFLEDAGYEVLLAEDGEQAWKLLNSNTDKPDILITDNEMPRLSGVDLTVRARATGLRLPVILASESLEWLDYAQLKQLEGVELLAKPYSREVLLDSVERALRKTPSGLHREHAGMPSQLMPHPDNSVSQPPRPRKLTDRIRIGVSKIGQSLGFHHASSAPMTVDREPQQPKPTVPVP